MARPMAGITIRLGRITLPSWKGVKSAEKSISPVIELSASSKDLRHLDPQSSEPRGPDAPAVGRADVGLVVMAEPVEIDAAVRKRLRLGPVQPILHRPDPGGGVVGGDLDERHVAVVHRDLV